MGCDSALESDENPPKIIAVASAGGHFMQLCRILPAFKGSRLIVATTNPGLEGIARDMAEAGGVVIQGFRVIRDTNIRKKLTILGCALDALRFVLKERPDVIVTTGAGPGYLVLRFGSMLGARTVWLDSIANADQLSLSGQKAGATADLWLTQWPHLSRAGGPQYKGSVL